MLQGGDVVQETIFSNVSEDTVTLEFQRSDGTLVTQLIDFTKVIYILSIHEISGYSKGNHLSMYLLNVKLFA